MHSLFGKIFLSFWLSMVLIVSVSMVITTQLTQTPDPQVIGKLFFDTMEKEASQQFLEGGRPALQRWLKDFKKNLPVSPLFLLDSTGVDLLGHPLSYITVDSVDQLYPKLSFLNWVDQRQVLTRRWEAHTGESFTFVLSPPRSYLWLRGLVHPTGRWMVMGIALLISGLLCLLLARYLTAPIRHLQSVTTQFAAGDLTARVGHSIGHRQDEIASLGHAFDHMAQRLEVFIATQQRLLRDVSHELRSPLARLQVALGLARQRFADDTQTELDRIELESERLNQLIGEILSLVRLENQTETGDVEAVDLHDLLREIVQDADYEAQLSERRVRLQAGLPLSICVQPDLLRRSVENVVRNAVRYTADRSTVEVGWSVHQAPSGSIIIWVRDHGPGVAEDALPQLFKPFFRVEEHRGRDRGGQGHGLGLAITERAVKLHGGYTTARNASDGGLIVELHLPTLSSL